jgi:hypothetical protein
LYAERLSLAESFDEPVEHRVVQPIHSFLDQRFAERLRNQLRDQDADSFAIRTTDRELLVARRSYDSGEIGMR